MDVLLAAYENGDIKWLIPAMAGALIVMFGLVRLVFSRHVGWALATLIAFGGLLSGVSVISKASFGTEGFDLETVAAAGEAGEKLKDAVSSNTQAIEGVKAAVSEMRAFTEKLAAAAGGTPGPGAVLMSGSEISRFTRGVEQALNETDLALARSRESEQEAVRSLEILNQAIEQRRLLPAR